MKHTGYNNLTLGVEVVKDNTIRVGIGVVNMQTSGSDSYNYKFQGQERQDEFGLGWDSFKWRNYDVAIGRFFNPDPLSEKYSYQSHYNFSENRVIDARELEGLEAHILFGSRDDAATNFAQQYNGKSIIIGKEYVSTIYSQKTTDGRVLYAYTTPEPGGYSKTVVSNGDMPENAQTEAITHTHGNYISGFDNNNFSGEKNEAGDKGYASKHNIDIYVSTPDGSLKVYDPQKDTEKIISQNIPSDPNDPERKNNINPSDSPTPVETKPVKVESDYPKNERISDPTNWIKN